MIPDNTPTPNYDLIKAVGAICGAILSLVYDNPHTMRELLARAVFSSMAGFIFAFVAIDRFGWAETMQHWLAASALMGAVAWLLAGVATRVLRAMNSWPPGAK